MVLQQELLSVVMWVCVSIPLDKSPLVLTTSVLCCSCFQMKGLLFLDEQFLPYDNNLVRLVLGIKPDTGR